MRLAKFGRSLIAGLILLTSLGAGTCAAVSTPPDRAARHLLNFDVTGGLSRITMSVILIAGRYDEARPQTVEKFDSMIPRSRVAIMENSGHMAPLEEYERYAQVLAKFLNEVDSHP